VVARTPESTTLSDGTRREAPDGGTRGVTRRALIEAGAGAAAAALGSQQALAQEGYVVFRIDPRTASGKGAVSAWAGYKQLGVQELRDLCALLKPRGRLRLWVPIDDWRAQRNAPAADENHHLYTWTPLLMRNLLEEAGLSVMSVRVISHAWPPHTARLASLPRPLFDALGNVKLSDFGLTRVVDTDSVSKQIKGPTAPQLSSSTAGSVPDSNPPPAGVFVNRNIQSGSRRAGAGVYSPKGTRYRL